MRVVDRQFDRAQLVPGELVGPGAVAEDRLFVEGVDRDLVELVATGAGEIGEVLPADCWGTGCRGWRTDARRGRRPRRRRRSPAEPRQARSLSGRSGCGRSPPLGRSARPRGAPPSAGRRRAAARRAMPASRISSTVTPWSIAAWPPRLSARLWRDCTASTAGSAPSAPIASVASSQSRSRERAIRQPQATTRESRPPRE